MKQGKLQNLPSRILHGHILKDVGHKHNKQPASVARLWKFYCLASSRRYQNWGFWHNFLQVGLIKISSRLLKSSQTDLPIFCIILLTAQLWFHFQPVHDFLVSTPHLCYFVYVFLLKERSEELVKNLNQDIPNMHILNRHCWKHCRLWVDCTLRKPENNQINMKLEKWKNISSGQDFEKLNVFSQESYIKVRLKNKRKTR